MYKMFKYFMNRFIDHKIIQNVDNKICMICYDDNVS